MTDSAILKFPGRVPGHTHPFTANHYLACATPAEPSKPAAK